MTITQRFEKLESAVRRIESLCLPQEKVRSYLCPPPCIDPQLEIDRLSADNLRLRKVQTEQVRIIRYERREKKNAENTISALEEENLRLEDIRHQQACVIRNLRDMVDHLNCRLLDGTGRR